MLTPIAILAFAILAAAGMTYGTHQDLAHFKHGIDWIIIGRRLQWPLAAASLMACIAILGLVVSGRRRAWWLLGLGPILALFAHRFSPQSNPVRAVLENAPFVEPAARPDVDGSEFVVGLIFEGQAYALPYRALYTTPIVEIVDYDKRMLVLWSAPANRATAVTISRELRPRDLEVVCTPANSLLIYDRRLGQFISGVTGKTTSGKPVIGFQKPVPVDKLTWDAWRTKYPQTHILAPMPVDDRAPDRPILPQARLPAVDPALEPDAFVAMISTTQPAVIPSDIPTTQPINTSVGKTRILIVRDPKTKVLHVFDRKVGEDLSPRFSYRTTRKAPEAVLVDSDSNSAWTITGRAVEGPLKGQKLKELEIDDLLYWGVMTYWYPDLQLIDGASNEPTTMPADAPDPTVPKRRPARRRTP